MNTVKNNPLEQKMVSNMCALTYKISLKSLKLNIQYLGEAWKMRFHHIRKENGILSSFKMWSLHIGFLGYRLLPPIVDHTMVVQPTKWTCTKEQLFFAIWIKLLGYIYIYEFGFGFGYEFSKILKCLNLDTMGKWQLQKNINIFMINKK